MIVGGAPRWQQLALPAESCHAIVRRRPPDACHILWGQLEEELVEDCPGAVQILELELLALHSARLHTREQVHRALDALKIWESWDAALRSQCQKAQHTAHVDAGK